jgi:thiamine biosynthesis lipoprotein ApbE
MSRFVRSASLLLALVVSALLATACGGEQRLTKAQYEKQVRALYGEVRAAFQATRDVKGAVLAERIDTASTKLRIAAQQLDMRFEPPKEVEEHNEELAEGMLAYSVELLDLVQALERGDKRALHRYNARIPRSREIERMAEAAEEMKFMGYDLGVIAKE